MHDPLIGRKLGHFKVERLIAEGGMGLIYQATHTVIGRKAAIKVLTERYSSDKNMIKRLHREARAVNRIGHPNIIDIFDFGQTEDNREYFVMEYLPGKSLAQIQEKQKRLPWSLIAPVLSQTLDALGAAHELGIIHRDVKPENILVIHSEHDEFLVKVLDFGIAKSVGLGPEGERLTRAGNVMGTPEYISPEQIRGRDVDGRSDLYAVGAILFEMIMGRRPFESEKVVSLLMMHLRDPVPRMDHIPPELGIPPFVPAVVNKAMAKDPLQRYPDARTFARALELETRAVIPSDGTRPLPELYWQQDADPDEPTVQAPSPFFTQPGSGFPSELGPRQTAPDANRLPTALMEDDEPRAPHGRRWIFWALPIVLLAGAVVLYLALRPPSPAVTTAPARHPDAAPVAPPARTVDLPELAERVRRILRSGMRTPDADARRRCVNGLGTLREGDALALLAAALKDDPERGVRSAAAHALAQLSDPKAAAILLEARGQSDEVMQIWLNESLMLLGNAAGKPALTAALKSTDKEVRFQAALALGESGDHAAIPALEAMAREAATADRQTVIAVLGTLARLGHRDSFSALGRALAGSDAVLKLGAAEALIRLGSETAVDTLKGLLTAEEQPTRLVAAKLLASLGDFSGMDNLSRGITAKEASIRQLATEGLGHVSDRAALPLLAQVLEDESWSVKATAAEALARLLSQMPSALIRRSQDWIKTALANRDWAVRHAAVGVTAEMDPELAISLLGWAFRDKDPRVRVAALASLERLKSKKAVPLLAGALSDDSEEVRARAAVILAAYPEKTATAALQGAVHDRSQTVRAMAAGALLAHGDTSYLADLRAAARGRQPALRRAAITALGRWEDPQAIHLLRTALKDRDRSVRFAAAVQLARRGQKDGERELRRAIGHGGEEESVALQSLAALGLTPAAEVRQLAASREIEARRHAMETAALLDKREAVDLLRRGSEDPDPAVRLAAARSLTRLAADPRALPLLRVLARDPVPAVRTQASLGMARVSRAAAAPDMAPVKPVEPAPLPVPPRAPPLAKPTKGSAPVKPLLFDDTNHEQLYKVHSTKATVAASRGKYDLALSHLKQAKGHSDKPPVLFELGLVHFKLALRTLDRQPGLSRDHLTASRGYYQQYLKRAPGGKQATAARRGLNDVARLLKQLN